MNIKKIIVLLATLTCLPLMAQTTLADRPAAVVQLHKTEVIPLSKFNQYVQVLQMQNGGNAMTNEEKRMVLDTMINQMLVKQDAAARNITVTEQDIQNSALEQLSLELQQSGMIPQGAYLNNMDQFNQVLQGQGMSVALYMENIKNNLIVQRYIVQVHEEDFKSVAPPSDREIKNFYNGNIQLFAVPEYVQIRQIFFDLSSAEDKAAVKQSARNLLNKIENGQVSFDSALTTEGDLFPLNQEKAQPLYIASGDEESLRIFGAPFTDSLFDNRTIGRPYLQESNVGMHIFVVDQWKEADIRTLDDTISPVQSDTVSDYIKQVLFMEKQQNLYAELQQQVIEDLRSQAGEEGIRVFEDAIK